MCPSVVPSSNGMQLFKKFPLLPAEGLQTDDSEELTVKKNAILQKVDKLHEQIKLGIDVQKKLDSYIWVYKMINENNPILTVNNIDFFITHPKHIFGLDSLYDIGRDIRSMFTGCRPKNFVVYLIEYSLPYIKHNRLSLPSYETIDRQAIRNFTRIIFACVLGMFPHCKRKPTWATRIQIFSFFHDLFASSSDYQIYTFCSENIPLLRISVIEYYIYFILQNLPIEKSFNECYFRENNVNISQIYENTVFIIDTFRQSCLQQELCWKKIDNCALIAVEKLNRLCKGKTTRVKKNTKITYKELYNVCKRISADRFFQILQIPVFNNCYYYDRIMNRTISPQHQFSMEELLCMKKIQNAIRLFNLPKNIVDMQHNALSEKIATMGPIAQHSTILHFCLLCNSNHSLQRSRALTGLHTVRFNKFDMVSCDFCKESTHMLKINMVGRMAKIFETFYYFCHFCCQVHTWRNDGTEFFSCNKRRVAQSPVKSKQCLLCHKLHHETIHVLDDKLGLMQEISLCKWHAPHEHSMSYIYNLDSLWKTIIEKTSKRQHHRTFV